MNASPHNILVIISIILAVVSMIWTAQNPLLAVSVLLMGIASLL